MTKPNLLLPTTRVVVARKDTGEMIGLGTFIGVVVYKKLPLGVLLDSGLVATEDVAIWTEAPSDTQEPQPRMLQLGIQTRLFRSENRTLTQTHETIPPGSMVAIRSIQLMWYDHCWRAAAQIATGDGSKRYFLLSEANLDRYLPTNSTVANDLEPIATHQPSLL